MEEPRGQPRTGRQAPSTAARLVGDVTGGWGTPGLVAELEAWVVASSRFRAFVEANQAKIRRKVREATDPEAVRDVRAELLVAARLLADRRVELAFEAYGARRPGPDFTVTFRRATRFNVEVTRRRGRPDGAAVADAATAKLRQLPPSIANVLVVALDQSVEVEDLDAAMRALRARVDARDPAALARVRAAGPREFYERFLRLTAVIAWVEGAGRDRVHAWGNASARFNLDRRALAAVVDCLAV